MFAEDDWYDAPLARQARSVWRILLVAYLVPVTVATHWPRLAFQGSGTVDKFVHFVGFGLLAWLFLNAALFRRPILNFALGAFWVYFDEVTQSIEILGRTFSGYDMIAGWLGCAVAGIVFFGMRIRAPRATDERLCDLTAERLAFSTVAGWLRVGLAALGFVAAFVGTTIATQWYIKGEAASFGSLVFPAWLGFLIGATYGGVGAVVRSHARVGGGWVDAWTGATVTAPGAPEPRFRLGDYAPALRVPLMVGGVLAFPAWLAALGVEALVFGEMTEEKLVDSAGFTVLRPIFAAMLAFAGAVVVDGVMVRMHRAGRGFRALRPRP